MVVKSYDVIVVGAGPAGSGCAAYCAMNGLKTLLIDKTTFPRDKICGDAVGGKSLKHIDAIGAHEEVISGQHAKYSGITMSSPNGNTMTIALGENELAHNTAGYVVPRIRLDNAIMRAASRHVKENDGDVQTGCKVKSIIWGSEHDDIDPGKGSGDQRVAKGVLIQDSSREEQIIKAEIVIGAGGYNCPIARELVIDTYDEEFQEREHWSAAYREYYRNVDGCVDQSGEIEIHFINEILPGYFWIFPAGDGIVNVGIGMRMDMMDKQSIKLKAMQEWVVKEHSLFKKRFENSELIKGSGKGWLLPMGSPRGDGRMEPRRASGNGVFLIGDATSLVDPFTGEGIGNALESGEMAARFAKEIFEGKSKLIAASEYQVELWEELGSELSNSYKLQKMLKKKRLMNWFIGKASRKPKLQAVLTDMMASKDSQSKVHSKWFLFKALFF